MIFPEQKGNIAILDHKEVTYFLSSLAFVTLSSILDTSSHTAALD